MVAEIWASVISSFVDQLVALKVVDDDLSVLSMSEMGLQKRLDSSRMTRLPGRVYIII